MAIDGIVDADERAFERQRACAIGCLGIIGISLLAMASVACYFSYGRGTSLEYRNK